MPLFLKILVLLIGVLFSLIGLVGLFQPAQLAETLGFGLPTAESVGQMRAMIGAHYVAMGAVCLFAGIRNRPGLLLPIAMIEAAMLAARMIAVINGEFTSAVIVPTVIEIVAASVLFMAARRA